jgi:hypothetical protein
MEESANMKRIMIVGSPRSGTTLLQQLISGHQDIFTTRETHFFDFFILPFQKPVADSFKNWTQWIKENSILVFEPENTIKIDFKPYISYFVNLMDYNARLNKKHIWLEKTPVHLFYTTSVQAYYPDLIVWHVIRDPLDTVASLVDVGRKHKSWKEYRDLNVAIAMVNRSLKKTSEHKAMKNNYFVLFSDLINTPQKTAAKICETLEIEYNEQVYAAMLKNIGNENTYNPCEHWKQTHGRSLNQHVENKFLNIFNQKEQDWIKANTYKIHDFFSADIFI